MSDWHTKHKVKKRGGTGMIARAFINKLQKEDKVSNHIKNILNNSIEATLREYATAMRNGAYVLATRIEVANPDLSDQFEKVRAELPPTV